MDNFSQLSQKIFVNAVVYISESKGKRENNAKILKINGIYCIFCMLEYIQLGYLLKFN